MTVAPLVHRILALGALACVAASCHDDDSLRIGTIIEVPVTVQGGNAGLTVSAYPASGDRVTAIIIDVTGAFGIYDSTTIREHGDVTVGRSYVIPLGSPNGTATVVARARSRHGDVATQTTTFQVLDDEAPHFVLNTSPAILHPGDTIQAAFEVSDNVRVKYTLLRFTGAYNRLDSLFVGAQGRIHVWPYPLPDTATGSSIVVTAFAIDYVGNTRDSVLATLPLVPR